MKNFILVIIILTTSVNYSYAAPVPIKEKPIKKKYYSLYEVNLVGKWNLIWGGCEYKETYFYKNHDYTSQLSKDYYSYTIYKGSWWVEDGYLYIYESLFPENGPKSFNKVKIYLNPNTLEGYIIKPNDDNNILGVETKIKLVKVKDD